MGELESTNTEAGMTAMGFLQRTRSNPFLAPSLQLVLVMLLLRVAPLCCICPPVVWLCRPCSIADPMPGRTVTPEAYS